MTDFPLLRYSSTWDVQVVLNYTESLGGNCSLTLMLMALTRPTRSADLSKLDLKTIYFRMEGIEFSPTSLAKQSKQGKPVCGFLFLSFPARQELCLVWANREYEWRTLSIRDDETRLFLTIIKLHHAATSSTIT